MVDTTPRFALPLLAAGQAQKELFHNEALVLLEALAQPVAQGLGDNAPPGSPAAGQCWIVGSQPASDWAGHPGEMAVWTAGGWRFLAPVEGMWVWLASQSLWARRSGGAWVVGVMPASAITIAGVQVVGAQRPAIAAPSGGTAIDTAARTAVNAILAALRTHGLIAS